MEILLAIGIAGMILILILMMKTPTNINKQSRINTIDTKHLEEMILPNNKGRSIDDVVECMVANGITPEFYLEHKD